MKEFLANRLLNDTCKSSEAKNKIIVILKTEWGALATAKIEKMERRQMEFIIFLRC